MNARPKSERHPAVDAIGENFAEWLRTTREAKGMTRYAVWQKGGPLEVTQKAMEDKASVPRLDTFCQLCQALGENPSKVLTALLSKGPL